jgi:hypothetical protein
LEVRTRVWKQARDLVYNLTHCDNPIWDASLALTFIGFCGLGVQEGVAGLRERRPPGY